MSETVQKHLDTTNSGWQELAVTFGGPRRRTMICRMLRYLVVTATLFYYSRNFASASIRTLLGLLLNGKNSHPEGKRSRAITKPGTTRTR
jgi:hypothetical protein